MGDKCLIERCEEIAGNFLKSSKRVRDILDKMPSRPVVSCLDCSKSTSDVNIAARAVLRDSTPLEMILCCNRLKESEIEEVIIHELIHAYDYSKNRCDFSTCQGLAYSEVRAAREAECAKGFFPFEFMRKSCIRDHAIRSTANLFPHSAATSCVDTVLIAAIKDVEPRESL